MNKKTCTNCHNKIYERVGAYWTGRVKLSLHNCTKRSNLDTPSCYDNFIKWFGQVWNENTNKI